jgi:hypothetical protein
MILVRVPVQNDSQMGGGVSGTISFPSPVKRLGGICVCDVEMYTPPFVIVLDSGVLGRRFHSNPRLKV